LPDRAGPLSNASFPRDRRRRLSGLKEPWLLSGLGQQRSRCAAVVRCELTFTACVWDLPWGLTIVQLLLLKTVCELLLLHLKLMVLRRGLQLVLARGAQCRHGGLYGGDGRRVDGQVRSPHGLPFVVLCLQPPYQALPQKAKHRHIG
jgi:hypothetical protein